MERLTDTQTEIFRILQLVLTQYLQIYFSLSKPFFCYVVTGMLSNIEIFFSILVGTWIKKNVTIHKLPWTILFQRCQRAKQVKVFI